MSNLEVVEKNITDQVLNKVNVLEKQGGIDLPPNYSVANALKSAYLVLRETLDKNKRPVLETCSRESISSALLDMVVQGLNPAKHQCYFIAYGNQLKFHRSYLGSMALVKRLHGVKDVRSFPVYKDDVFKLDYDFVSNKKVIKEYTADVSKWENKNLRGACCVIVGFDEVLHVEYMTLEQIRAAWQQSKNTSNAVRDKFPDQMAQKTVINRACKYFIGASDDSYLDLEREDREIKAEIEQNANVEAFDEPEDVKAIPDVVDVEDVEVVDEVIEDEMIDENPDVPF